MSDLLASALKNGLGLQLLNWAVSQSDIWHLAHRCSELAHKINEPLEKSAYVLDNLLTMDEDDLDCIGIRELHMQQMHFDDEDDYNEEGQSRHIQPPATNTTSLTVRNSNNNNHHHHQHRRRHHRHHHHHHDQPRVAIDRSGTGMYMANIQMHLHPF